MSSQYYSASERPYNDTIPSNVLTTGRTKPNVLLKNKRVVLNVLTMTGQNQMS